MDLNQNCYWPFDVMSPEKLTEQHQKEIAFLEEAYGAGFKPYMFGSGSFGGTTPNRTGEIIYRGRTHWEARLEDHEVAISAHVVKFATASEALLAWLRGENEADIVSRLDQDLWSKRLPLSKSPRLTEEELERIAKHYQH